MADVVRPKCGNWKGNCCHRCQVNVKSGVSGNLYLDSSLIVFICLEFSYIMDPMDGDLCILM